MKSFGKGFLTGSVFAFSAVLGLVYAFKKSVIEPAEERDASFEQHRKRALRKSRSAHQG